MNIHSFAEIFTKPQYKLESWLLRHPKLLSDKHHIMILWKRTMNYPINLKNPLTFNEKLQWLKLNDHNPEYIKMVDKYEVKKFVEDIIGKEHIIPTLRLYESIEEIDFEKLPNQFVLKCTHDSGGLVICNDKTNFDIEAAKKKLSDSLKRNFYWPGREWPYKYVKPRIIAEQYMSEKKSTELPLSEGLNDYKFMCYNGVCKNLFVCTGRSKGDLRIDFFDTEWNHLPFYRKYKNSDTIIPKPENLKEMIMIAERIAQRAISVFSRIDLYTINKTIYFGEITFYPGNGMEYFDPVEWDRKFGDMIKLPTNPW